QKSMKGLAYVVVGVSNEPFGIGIDSAAKVRKAASAKTPTIVATERMITHQCALGRAFAQGSAPRFKCDSNYLADLSFLAFRLATNPQSPSTNKLATPGSGTLVSRKLSISQ